MKGSIEYLDYAAAVEFLLPKHYSGRKPQIKWAFGWKVDGEIKAVCTFGKPASNTLCDGICGRENSKYVYELNRLCRLEDFTEQLSSFVAACLRRLSAENLIIVSYADRGMHHNGYIYQACNFIYTGYTKERLEFYLPNGHSRHGSKDSDLRKIRTSKHRYVYFATKDKKLKNKWVECLTYKMEDYPKEKNENYILGEFQQPKIVNIG
jgi:hypothetical protein